MATVTVKSVEGNTAPPLTPTAKRNGVPIVLSGCTVNLILTQGGTQLNAGHTLCTITDALNGVVSYVRQAADTPTAGTYICDLVVTYPDTTVEVLYDQLRIKCRRKANSSV